MAFRGVICTRSANWTAQDLTGGTTAMPFDTETVDTDGFHNTVTSNSRITIPAAVNNKFGMLIGTVSFTNMGPGGDNFLIPRIFRNGSNLYINQWSCANDGEGQYTMTITTTIDTLTTGNFYEFVPQQGGAPNDTSVDAVSTRSSFSLWVIN